MPKSESIKEDENQDQGSKKEASEKEEDESDCLSINEEGAQNSINSDYFAQKIDERDKMFKRKFGEKDLYEFCEEKEIALNEASKIKRNTKMSLGFLEVANKNYQKPSTVVIQKEDWSEIKKVKLKERSNSADGNRLIDESKKDVEALKSKSQSSDKKSVKQVQESRVISSSNSNKSQKSRKQSRIKSQSIDLPEIMSSEDFTSLVKHLILERKLLQQISESAFTFFRQFEKEFVDIKAQSEMTMILLQDLLDFA